MDKIDVMIDTDMIASPNYARLVYDGETARRGRARRAWTAPGTIENVFRRYFAQHGMATLPIPFDGRSDYVGFVNRGIPSGGIFAGAEAPKTPEQVAMYGGVEGEQLDPCYHEACDNIDTVTGQPPADTMNVVAPTDAETCDRAASRPNSLHGNALKSLRRDVRPVTHAVWYFGQNRRAIARLAYERRLRARRAARGGSRPAAARVKMR